MDDNRSQRNSNSTLIAAIAVLAGLNTILLTSDVSSVVRYSLGTISVVALLVCVVLLTRNTTRRSDVDS